MILRFYAIGMRAAGSPGLWVLAVAWLTAGPAHAAFYEDFEGTAMRSRLGGFSSEMLVRGAVERQSAYAHSGRHAIRCIAENPVGKALLLKNDLSIGIGDAVTVSAWFLFPSGASLDKLFLMDLECKSCWPAEAGHNINPGIRLYLKGADGRVAVDRAKMGVAEGFLGADVPVPRNRWVEVTWRIIVGIDDAGYTEVQLDGMPVLARHGTNVPHAGLPGPSGFRFRDARYEGLQIGITANNSPGRLELFFDDVRVSGSGRIPPGAGMDQ